MPDDASIMLTPAKPKPDHVPDALVYDFDLYKDPGLLADPHARIIELHKVAPPIFWTPRGGWWVMLGHEADFEAGRDWGLFTSQRATPDQVAAMNAQLPAGAPKIRSSFPIGLDPPLHGTYRLPLNGAFSPKAINQLKDSIRALAAELIEAVKPQGGCELMATIAEPLPVQVFLKMMGVPVDQMPIYRNLVKRFLASLDQGPQASMVVGEEIVQAMTPVFLERRDNPQNDLISLLWTTTIEGKKVTMDDMENYGVLLFIAGLDTVMNGMGLGIRHMAEDPALQARLRKDPSLVPDAVEELLRRYTFTVPIRTVSKDAEFMGVQMKAGDQALLFNPGADLDPNYWDKPETFDLDREDKVHIAFGSGPHRCLGSHLARVELQILYEEMLARLPEFRLDPAKPPKFHGGHVIGVDTLNLLW
jgi:cytochrome P450